MEEKDPNSDFQNKNENDPKYNDSLFSIYINYFQIENEEKKMKKRRQNQG